MTDKHSKKNQSPKKKIWFKDITPENEAQQTNPDQKENPRKKDSAKTSKNKNSNIQRSKQSNNKKPDSKQKPNKKKLHKNKQKEKQSKTEQINKEESSPHQTKKTQPTEKLTSLHQRLISHIGEFLHIITTACCNDFHLKGVLCQVEEDFITLIDSLTIIEIPIDKIVSIVTKAKGTPKIQQYSSLSQIENSELDDKTTYSNLETNEKEVQNSKNKN